MKSHMVVLSHVSNAGIVMLRDGEILIVDTLMTDEQTEELRHKTAQWGKPSYVISTHEHYDHLGGNGMFSCPHISATAARKAMSKDPSISPLAYPQITFDSALTLHLSETVELRHMGGHSRGSIVVYFPDRQLLFAGDLVFNGRTPFMGVADLSRWISALRELESWDIKQVVPGHGFVGGKELLSAQREWIEEFVNQVKLLRDNGMVGKVLYDMLSEKYKVVERSQQAFNRGIELALKM